MDTAVKVVIGVAAALAVTWLALVVALLRGRPTSSLVTESLRLLPDLLRLLRRVAADCAVPRRARVGLWVLLAYLASPIDLIPDFIPVLGYADDVIAVAIVLRYVVRRTGTGALERHWPGTPDGLAAVVRLIGGPPAELTRGEMS